MKTKSETTDKTPISELEYEEQVEHWKIIINSVFRAEHEILETNRPILKDETKSIQERADLYVRNIAEEIIRATYAERA